ncbi:retrovirus-related pol polyprotein from transposon TNT 1-94 [Tanacetum coccineum]
MSQETVHIAMNSVDILDVKKSCVNDCSKCLKLKTELLKKKDFIENDVYEKLLKSYSTLEKHCISFVENVKKDIDEIELINIELEHSVAKLLSENENLRKEREHLKSIYKDQFDSIRKTRVQSKGHSLKNELRKLKGKNVDDTAVSKPNATIAPGMFKLDIEPISYRLKNNMDAHEVYIEKTIENIDTLRGFVKRARTQNPSKPLLESAYMFTKHVQELLVYVSHTRPNSPKPSEKLVAVTPMNKDKRVRFAEPVTSSYNIPKQTDSVKTKNSNKPLLTSTGVKPTTSASGSKPLGNTKNNRITRPPSSNKKNKVEEHPRKVKFSLNKMNYVSEPVNNALVKHSVRNAKFESICAICNKCLFDANPDMRPKATRSIGSSSKVKIVESKTSNFKEPKQSWGSTISDVPSFSLNNCMLSKLFGNDHIAKILGYGDYKIGNVTISRVIIVEGTDNGTEFVNQTLRAYYEEVRISHQTSVARTLQQNVVVERRNCSLVEVARTIEDLAMASQQLSSGPGLKPLTPRTISSELVPNIPSLTSYVPPTKNDWEILFQPMFDEYLNPPPCVDPQVPAVIAPESAVSTGTPSSTTIDQDAPSLSTSKQL